MNKPPKNKQTLTLAAATLAFAFAAMACTANPTSQPPSKNDSVANRKADNPSTTPASPVTSDEVLTPREGKGAEVDTSSYVVTEGPYRLFGVELGDGETRKTATIADGHWSTRAYGEGDAIGRGMNVVRINDDTRQVTLHSVKGDIVLSLGKDVELRVVRHKLDIVAAPLGRNRYALNTAAARATDLTPPAVELHDLYGGPVLKLGPLSPTGLFAQADFQEGDLIAAVDGAPASAASVDDITHALTQGRASFTAQVIRGGVPLDRVFTIDTP